MMSRIKILFLCTGNSFRSQMAAGSVNHLGRDGIPSFVDSLPDALQKPF